MSFPPATKCLGILPGTDDPCGTKDNWCSEVCMLRAALRPFADTGLAYGIRPPHGDDLWISFGLAHSAWWRAIVALTKITKITKVK